MPTPFEQFIGVLVQAGWTVNPEPSPANQPAYLTVSHGDFVLPLRVYIWNVTRGGPRSVRPGEEYRIQKMVRDPLEIGGDRLTLLMGWYEEAQVFVAWDVVAHLNARYSASIQVRAPYFEEALRLGMAIQPRTNPTEDVVIFTASLLPNYIEQASLIHGRQISNVDYTFPELDTQTIDQTEEDAFIEPPSPRRDRIPSAGTPTERRRVLRTLRGWWRSSTFRYAVAWAYDYGCSICGIGLNLINSAHIIPVTHPETSEHPSNGIALCLLHHGAYDAGIYGVNENFEIILNHRKINDLIHRNRAGGLDVFRDFTRVGQQIYLPEYEPYRPNPDLLRRALNLRGFD